jgi:outer membrane protein OmpA-like peptidoglycan-associated protein
VGAYLKTKGVDAERLRTVGKGEDPAFFVGDNATAEGRAKNRRVEIETAQ